MVLLEARKIEKLDLYSQRKNCFFFFLNKTVCVIMLFMFLVN